MTHPPDPGHPPRPQPPGEPGRPYGPPPLPQQPGPVPGPRPPGPGGPPTGPRERQQEWVPVERTGKGLVGTLLDANFNSLVTPTLIKTFYLLSMMVISLECLGFAGFGLWIASSTAYWLTGAVIILATPLIWLFQMLFVRFFMEAVMVRFKQAEYLRIIKDKI